MVLLYSKVDVLVRVLQKNRTDKIYRDIYKRRRISGMGSPGYGGLEDP